jgi:DNA repair exonuclease SbcCD nuclease subunit
MKILHFADLHIKLKSDDRYKYDLLGQLRFIIDVVKQYQPEYIFFAGDLFDKKEPTPTEYSLAHIFLKQLLDLGCTIVMIPGNHDQPDNEEAHHTLKPLKNLNLQNLFIFDEEGLYKVKDIDILVIPYKYHAKDVCLSTIRRLHDEYKGNELYLIGHIWVNEFSTITPSSSEFTVSSGWLQSLSKVKYGAIGHIHNGGQIIGNFYYSGSPYRTDWGEEEPSKYVSLYDSGNVGFIPTNARPIQVFDFETFDQSKISVPGTMVKIIAKDIDVSLVPELDKLQKELEAKGYPVRIIKNFKPISYTSAPEFVRRQKVTLENYIDDYVKRNNLVPEHKVILSICEDIVSEKIKMETSPFEIPILGLKP